MGASNLFKGVLVAGALAALAALAASAATPSITPMGTATPGCQGVAIEGSLACVVGGPAGLVTYDITDPSLPRRLGAAPLDHAARAVALAQGRAVIAARDAGLLLYDLSNPDHPEPLGQLETTGYAEDVAVHEDLAYVAAEWGGFSIVDVADPSTPAVLSTLADVKPALGLDLVFEKHARYPALAYVACGAKGIFVVNISEPYLPTVIARCELPDTVTDFAVQGNYGYAANIKGVAAIDLSDPAAPAPLVVRETAGWAMAVEPIEQYALVADAHSGLKMLDFGDWREPELAASWPYEGFVNDLTIAGQVAYLATSDGLQTFSVLPNYVPTIPVFVVQPYIPIQSTEWVDIPTSYSDLNGWHDLDRVALQIGHELSEASACYLVYDVQNDLLTLLDDDGEHPIGQARPGEIAVLSNSQAAVDCAHTKVSAEGTKLDITWRLRFEETMRGLNKAHLYARDVDGASRNWQRIQGLDISRGAYTATPYHSSLHPGQSQAFEFTYRGQGTWQGIERAEWMLHDETDATALHGAYDTDADVLMLFDGVGNVVASGHPGEERVIENDLVRVDLALCETQPMSDTLVVRWQVALKGAASGKHHALYMRNLLDEPFPARWAMVGDCLVNRAPAWGHVLLQQETIQAGKWLTMETTFVDPDGWQHIHDGLVLINRGLAGEAGFYVRLVNALDGPAVALYDDEGRDVLAEGAPGQDRVIENAQAAIDLARTEVTALDDTIRATWLVQFKETFTGTRYVHLWARDKAQATSDWKTAAQIEVTSAAPPQSGAEAPPHTVQAPPSGVAMPPYRPNLGASQIEGTVQRLDNNGPTRRQ